MMCSSFAGYFAISSFNLPQIWALVFALVFGVFISVFIELVAYRPLRKKKASRLFLMISAMGINILIINLAIVLLGANLRKFPVKLPAKSFVLGKVAIGQIDILAMVLSLVLITCFMDFS